MKLYKEFLALLIIVMFIPFSILSVYSVKTVETKVKNETFFKVKSLEEKTEIIFENIEMQCSMFGKRIEDIENNPGNYKNFYKKSEFFYLPNGGYVTGEPDKSYMWVPNTVRVTPKIKTTLGLLRNMDSFSEELMKNPYIKDIGIHRSNEIAYTYPPENITELIPQDLIDFLPESWTSSPLRPLLDFLLTNLSLQKIKWEMKVFYPILQIIDLIPVKIPMVSRIVDELKQYTDEEVLPGDWSAKSTNRPFYVVATPSHNPEKEVVWSPVFLELVSGGWRISCSAPLYDKEENFFGVESIDVDLDQLMKDLFDVKLSKSGYAFLINEKGNVLAYPKRAAKDLNLPVLKEEERFLFTVEESYALLNLSLFDHPNKEFVDLLNLSLEGKTIQRKVKLGEEKYLVLIPLEHLNWVIGAIVPYKEVVGPIRDTILMAVGIAAVVCITASLWMGKRIAHSFTKISTATSKITKGDLSTRVDIKLPIREFSSVSEDINQMVSSLQNKIEEIHERETEVRDARAYAEAVIANIADPLWVTDRDGNWILVNKAMEEVTGYNKKDVLEKQMLTNPLFRLFIGMLDGKEKLKAMMKKVKAEEHVSGLNIPWLTKDGRIIMMSCSGEPLKDAGGGVIGGVFIGKDMSTLQSTGFSATKILARKVESEVGENYELATLLFMSNATMLAGDSSLEILRGTVEGYNKRFNKNIGIKEGVALTNIPEDDWPPFTEFLLSTFYECIGPMTFECSEGIKTFEGIVGEVKAKYGG